MAPERSGALAPSGATQGGCVHETPPVVPSSVFDISCRYAATVIVWVAANPVMVLIAYCNIGLKWTFLGIAAV